MYIPKKFKYKKLQKCRIKNIYQQNVNKYNGGYYGSFLLKALVKGEITPQQLESVRKKLIKEIKKFGKIWIRVFSTIIRTSKPAEVRMGKGKGSLNYWACKIKAGQILFEISNIGPSRGYFLLKKVSKSLPLLTKVLKKK
jgi:large subunit ribosomal protein L16